MQKFHWALAVVALILTASAEECYWIGTGGDSYWTNPGNWKDGKIPGHYRKDGEIVGQFGDIAVFGSTECVERTASMGDLVSVGGLKFIGTDPGQYTIGGNGQKLPLEMNGFGIEIDADVEQIPIFAAGIIPGENPVGCQWITKELAKNHIYLVNNTEQVLDIPRFNCQSARVTGDKATGDWPFVTIHFSGKGGYTLHSGDGNGMDEFVFNQEGVFTFARTIISREGGADDFAPVHLSAGPDVKKARVCIPEGITVVPRALGPYIRAEKADLEFFGAGTLGVSWKMGSNNNDLSHISVGEGRTLTIGCSLGVFDGTGKMVQSADKQLNIDNVASGAVVRITGPNISEGPVQFMGKGTFEAMAIDGTDGQGDFGLGARITMAGGGELKYMGPGETTTRTIALVNKNANGAGMSAALRLTHAGTGPWTVQDFLFDTSTSGSLFLDGARDDATLDCALTDGGASDRLTLFKYGSGTWTLTGENTYCSSTFIYGGTLALAVGSTLSQTEQIVFNGPGALVVAGDETPRTFTMPKLRSNSKGVVRVTGKTTLVLTDMTEYPDGDLALELDADAKVVFAQESWRGKVVKRLLLNGLSARVDEEGVLGFDADAVIGAHGDTVPHSAEATSTVLIYGAGTGTGNDTIAEDTTWVGTLRQGASEPATIEIGEGRSLAAKKFEIESVGEDLILGTEGDAGMVRYPIERSDANQYTFEFNNRNPDSEIRLNAAVPEIQFMNVCVGKVKMSDAKKSLGQVCVAKGTGNSATLVLDDADIELTSWPLMVGYGEALSGSAQLQADNTIAGRMVITNSRVCTSALTQTAYTKGYHYALSVGHNAQGLLEIQEGAVLTNKLMMGGTINHAGDSAFNAGGGWAAVRQTGGSVGIIGATSAPHTSSCIGMGTSSQGYYEFDGGTFAALGVFSIGGYGTGLWHQFGGTAKFEKNLASPNTTLEYFVASGNGGAGFIYLADGTMDFCNNYFTFVGGSLPGQNRGVLSVTGPDSFLDVHARPVNSFNVGIVGNTGLVSVVRGGTIRTAGFHKRCGLDESPLHISFDEGTLRAGDANRDVFCYNGEATNGVSSVVIYAGGATIDTDGQTGTHTKSVLRGAYGKGVAAIPFDLATLPKDRVCPPAIWICGDGVGATAHALFDIDTRSVTNIVITSPGSGYTWAKAKAFYGNNSLVKKDSDSNMFVVDCVLADNENTGSFTKAGAGDLTLEAVNTWGGDTVLAGGTLKAGVAGAIPSGSTVVLAGGALDMNGQDLPTAWAIDAAAAAAAGGFSYPGELVFPAGSTLVVRNADQVPEGKSRTLLTATGGISGAPAATGFDESKWHLSVSGNRLRLCRNIGMMLLVR